MIRETSLEAYEHLVTNGTLAEKNRVVYDHLYNTGPTTQKKTERYFNDRTYTLRPRFAQLEKMGLIKVTGDEVCEETNRRNLLWDVTSVIEPKKDDKLSFKEAKEIILADIIKLGERVPMTYKGDFRKIYHKLKEL